MLGFAERERSTKMVKQLNGDVGIEGLFLTGGGTQYWWWNGFAVGEIGFPISYPFPRRQNEGEPITDPTRSVNTVVTKTIHWGGAAHTLEFRVDNLGDWCGYVVYAYWA